VSGPLLTARFHVVMADVDAAQILYFATPLRWAERMFSRWRREVGLPMSEMLRTGTGTPAVRSEITYAASLHLDEEVEATMWCDRRSTRSYTTRYDFAAGPEGPLATQVWLTQATIERDADGRMRSVPIPGDLAAALGGG